MTPLELDILTHYAVCVGDYRSGDFSAPAVRESIDELVKRGVLRLSNGIESIYAMNEDAAKAVRNFIGRLELVVEFGVKVNMETPENPNDFQIKFL